MILSIFFFVIVMLGLGYSLTSFTHESGHIFERWIMRLGIGVGVFVILGVVFNIANIPIDWFFFLVLSLVIPIIRFVRNYKECTITTFRFKKHFNKENIYALVALLIFCFSLFMYATGAFSYPYLENDDPWHHADSVTYISVEKTLNSPDNYKFKYLDPYPPGFGLIMGVLNQTNSSLSWTLKFFNALIISLSGLFFYFFAKRFTQDRQLALFSMFVLISLPSFFTHFIWAHTLVIMLFFPAMYCLEKSQDDKRWIYPGAMVVAGILLTQQSQAFKIGVLVFVYLIVKSIYQRSFDKNVFYSLIGGLFLSLTWWGSRAIGALGTHQSKILASSKYSAITAEASTSLFGKVKSFFPYNQGTATRAYTFQDFFSAKPFGMINVQVGWGIVVTILLALGIIYILLNYKNYLSLKLKKYWLPVTLIWFIFTFLGTNSMTFSLPLGLFAFRFWLLLAIPVALLSWMGLKFILDLNKKMKLNVPTVIIITLVIVGIFFTSATAKYNQNAKAIWPPGQEWLSNEEIELFVFLKGLPLESKVYSYGGKGPYILGMDQFSCNWCPEEISLRSSIYELDAKDLHKKLRLLDYEYLIFEVGTIKALTRNNKTQEEAIQIVNEKLQEIIQSGLFTTMTNINNGGMIFRIQ